MRIEILQQMTDEELGFLCGTTFAYIDLMKENVARNKGTIDCEDYEKLLQRGRTNLRKIIQVQEERRHDADNGITTNNKYGFKIKHGKIVESTEQQLYTYWLDHWSEIYSFTDYLQKCKDAATKIIDK